jgi:DnaK suppressor protein
MFTTTRQGAAARAKEPVMHNNPDLDPRVLDELRHSLSATRQMLLRDRRASESELAAIEAEREIEWEEMAQEEHAADVRTRLSAQQYRQLRQIDGALERADRGEFGACLDCGEAIPLERLRAQPWATWCSDCAERRDEGFEPDRREPADRPPDYPSDAPDASADEHHAGTPLPPELSSLDDGEIVATIREAFRIEVGEALDDVRILCRDGVVILAGEVPNEALPEVARRIVEDEVGYEVVDRMLVTEFAGGPQAERKTEAPPEKTPTNTISIDADDVEGEMSEDVLEVEEEGLLFVPPTRPVPER